MISVKLFLTASALTKINRNAQFRTTGDNSFKGFIEQAIKKTIHLMPVNYNFEKIFIADGALDGDVENNLNTHQKYMYKIFKMI